MRIIFILMFAIFLSAQAFGRTKTDHTYRSEKIKYTFKGPNCKLTDVFEIGPHWLLKYRNQSSGHFAIVVYSEEGKYIDLAANLTHHCLVDIEQYTKGGKYYLDVKAKGNWTIKIIEMELRDGKRVKTHHEYLKEGWEKKKRSPHG